MMTRCLRWTGLTLAITSWLALGTAFAADKVSVAEGKKVENPPAPPIKEVSPGVFELGTVRMDKAKRTVTFPAKVNMTEGLVEYWLVSSAGKLHESILSTETEPYHIHLAMLFLGAKVAPPFNPEKPPEPQSAQGERISLWVSWASPQGAHRHRGEELIFNKQTKAAMAAGDWVYNGSWIFDGTFIAQRERSVVAIMADMDALANNPRPGRDNDEIWEVRKDLIPAAGTAVQVTIQIEKPAEPPAKKL